MERISFLVSGKVQGVGFRYFTRQAARSLGIYGWVRNLESGAVEVEAWGPTPALESLLAACRKGPPNSLVSDLSVQSRTPVDAAVFDSFEVR